MVFKHYRKRGRNVTIGSAMGYKWSFSGFELGWVPRPLALVLPYAPPMLSEVDARYRNDFYTPDESLPGGKEYSLFKWQGSNYVADIADGWDGFAYVGDERLTFDELVARGKASRGGKAVGGRVGGRRQPVEFALQGGEVGGHSGLR